jgi:hypothetical protein
MIKHTCTHNPFTIFTGSDTLASFLKLEILQQLHSVRILGIVFQAALSASSEPFWEGPSGVRARDGVYRHLRLVRELHGGEIPSEL